MSSIESAKKGSKKSNVVEFSGILEKVSEQHKISKIKLKKAFQGIFDVAAEGLKKGNEVQLIGLGLLRVRDVPPRAAGSEDAGKPRAEHKVVLLPSKKFKTAAGL